MRRIAAVACLVATVSLMSVQAEARPRGFRSSGSTKTSSTVVIIPGTAGVSRVQAGEAAKPARVPFPPSTIAREEPPPQLRLTANESAQKPWCRSDVVVGGFCVMN